MRGSPSSLRRLATRLAPPAWGQAFSQFTSIRASWGLARRLLLAASVTWITTGAAQEFTVVVLPDTQNYTAGLNGGSPEIFQAQVDWILANRARSNIVFVVHTGDVVERGDWQLEAWWAATNALYRLEDSELTGCDHGLPYSVAMGNHDGNAAGQYAAWWLHGTHSVFYNRYFGASRFVGRPYYGGHFGTNYNNHFHLFSASGLDFLVLSLEYGAGQNAAVMEWANRVLLLHRQRRAIVVSHSLLTPRLPVGFNADGQAIYNALKDNPNLFLMLCGHDPQTLWQQNTSDGHTITTLLADYENEPQGGNGWLRLLRFVPRANRVQVRTYSPTLDQMKIRAADHFDFGYDMCTPSGPETNLLFDFAQTWKYSTNNLDGTAWSAPEYADHTWPSGAGLLGIEDASLPVPKRTPLPPRSTDGKPRQTYYFRTTFRLANAAAVTSLTCSNLLDDGAVFYLNGHEIQRVRMGQGTVRYNTFANREIGDATCFDVFRLSGPDLACLREGTNVLAVEVHQATSLSSDVVLGASLTVVREPSRSTFVWLLCPTNRLNTWVGTPLTVTAAVSGVLSPVLRVAFQANGQRFAEASAPPYTAVWQADRAGCHTLRAVAWDSYGLAVTSSVVTLECIAPPVMLTRGPYLQLGTPESVIVRWRTDVPTLSRVRYGTNLTALTETAGSEAWTTNHSVRLSNLKPATRYYYAVESATGVLAPAHALQYYQTSPAPGAAQPLRVWVIGDAGSPENDAGPQIAVRDAFYAVNGTQHVDVWLQLGDNAYPCGTDAEYQHGQFNMYRDLLARTVTWPTLGNHDTANSTAFSPRYCYFEVFDLPTRAEAGGVPSGVENWYSFDYGNAHFIALDTQTADLSTNGPMARWLQEDLAANTRLWTIAFFHHSPYSKGHRDSDTDPAMTAARENLVPLLEAGGVDLVLTGHSHVYERSFLLDGHYGTSATFTPDHRLMDTTGHSTNGIGGYVKPTGLRLPHQGAVYAVVGCSGMSTGGGSLNHPAMATSRRGLGSLLLNIHGPRLDAVFLAKTGAIEDSFTLLKDEPQQRLVTVRPTELQHGRQVVGQGIPGRLYTVEATDDLRQSHWQPVGRARANANGVFTLDDPLAPTSGYRFYRAR